VPAAATSDTHVRTNSGLAVIPFLFSHFPSGNPRKRVKFGKLSVSKLRSVEFRDDALFNR